MDNKFQKLIQQEKGEFGTLKELFSSHFGLKISPTYPRECCRQSMLILFYI